MKNKLIIFLLTLSTGTVLGQRLEDCSDCNSNTYKETDILDNELFEIELLRNEIFARHNYIFKNERLNDYFSKFPWQKAVEDEPFSNSDLNFNENENIKLFKKVEAKIKQERQVLIKELMGLQSAILSNDTAKVNAVIPEINSSSSSFKILKSAFQAISVEEINWFKGMAQFTLTKDNGVYKTRTAILIDKNIITIYITDPMAHSDLMTSEEAFEYPSVYFSEDEYMEGVELIFKEGKLSFKGVIAAG